MSEYLGLDTSNYTTSACVYDTKNHRIYSQKRLLPVAKNQAGLRQSDAVFAHIKQLDEVISELFLDRNFNIKAVCASNKPRSVEGSYMPAFLVGAMTASSIASVNGIKSYTCSHQEGHIVAALYSAGKEELLQQEFYAFHISGGTTECLQITPKDRLFEVKLIAKTLDLNAGQLIDRVGIMLGMDFPCGAELDRLSLKCGEQINIKPSFKGLDCHLSGVQNQCEALMAQGKPKEYIASYAISYINAVIDKMTADLLKKHGEKPIVYSGGVMSNTMIRKHIEGKFGGYFAAPEYSTDNAAGVAAICSILDS